MGNIMVTWNRISGGIRQDNHKCIRGQHFLDYVLIEKKFTLYAFINIEVNISANLSLTPFTV